jgi:hypothetical protein
MKKAIKPTAPSSKKKIQGNLARPDEDIHDKIPVKERKRLELEKVASLAKIRAEREQSYGTEVINGQEVYYLIESGSDGVTWRVYGVGILINEQESKPIVEKLKELDRQKEKAKGTTRERIEQEAAALQKQLVAIQKKTASYDGTLTRFSSGKWMVRYNYQRVVTDHVHSRRKRVKSQNTIHGMPMQQLDGSVVNGSLGLDSREVPFFFDLEVLHYALSTPIKNVSRSSIAPARSAITKAIASSIKSLDGEVLREMAGALDALKRAENLERTEKQVIDLIEAEANRLQRVPCMNEVQRAYEAAFPREDGKCYDDSRWSQIFKEAGFGWLPYDKSGPRPKSQGRSVRQAR